VRRHGCRAPRLGDEVGQTEDLARDDERAGDLLGGAPVSSIARKAKVMPPG
jgi:hypothetical protein